MIRIEVKVDDAELAAAVARLREFGRDTTPVMRRCAGVLASAAEDAFAEEADPVTGARWRPLAESTAAARAASGHAGKILQLSGGLAASLSRDYGKNYAVVGSNREYAAAHQFGARTKPHTIRAVHKKALKIPGVGPRKSARHPGSVIPARPFLGIGPEEERDILDIFRNEISRALFG